MKLVCNLLNYSTISVYPILSICREHCVLYHFIHSFVEETFIDAIRIEHTERMHIACKCELKPHPHHVLALVGCISLAEVIRTIVDPKSVKGLQLNKPIFQVSHWAELHLPLHLFVHLRLRILNFA